MPLTKEDNQRFHPKLVLLDNRSDMIFFKSHNATLPDKPRWHKVIIKIWLREQKELFRNICSNTFA